MKEIYYFTPKETIEALGINGVESRRHNSDNSIAILLRGDMLSVHPETSIDSEGNEVIPAGYIKHDGILIHESITPRTHAQTLAEVSNSSWTINS